MEIQIDGEIVHFMQFLQKHFDREEILVAMLTGIAAEECVARGYPDEAIETLTETLLQVVHHERDRQAAGAN